MSSSSEKKSKGKGKELNMFFWGPVVHGLLSYSDMKDISFIDLVDAHKAIEEQYKVKFELIKSIGEAIGKKI